MKRLLAGAAVTVLAVVLAACGSSSSSSVSGCTTAIATGEINGTMTSSSPMPAPCSGLSKADLSTAVSNALAQYLKAKEAVQ